jgi:hypothetical protein
MTVRQQQARLEEEEAGVEMKIAELAVLVVAAAEGGVETPS